MKKFIPKTLEARSNLKALSEDVLKDDAERSVIMRYEDDGGEELKCTMVVQTAMRIVTSSSSY